MKKFTIFLLLVNLSLSLQAQWKVSKTGLSNYLIDEMCVINESTIWVRNQSNNEIAYTLDGGENWKVQYLPSEYTYGGFWATNDSTVFVTVSVGTNSPGILKSTNAGLNWVFDTVAFNSQSSYPGFLYFWDEINGLAISDAYPNENFEIHFTSDGGNSWSRVSDDNMPSGNFEWTFNSHSFFRGHSDAFYFGTNSGRIFYTTDMGKNWSVIYSPDILNGQNYSFDFVNPSEGLFSYYDNTNNIYLLYATENGGNTWEEIPIDGYIGDLYFDKTHQVYFASNYKFGIKYSSETDLYNWTVHPSFVGKGIKSVKSDSSSNRIYFGGWSDVFISEGNDFEVENPSISNVAVQNSHQIDVVFTVEVDDETGTDTSNYYIYIVQDEDETPLNYQAGLKSTNTERIKIQLISISKDTAEPTRLQLQTVTELSASDSIVFNAYNLKDIYGNDILGKTDEIEVSTISEVSIEDKNNEDDKLIISCEDQCLVVNSEILIK